MEYGHEHSSTPTKRKPPFGVFVASTIVIFFLTLSAADSIGFVPNYIDGTAPVAENPASDTSDPSSDTLALSKLPELGLPGEGEVSDPAVATALPTSIEIPAIDLD